jgi:hypothetical protein
MGACSVNTCAARDVHKCSILAWPALQHRAYNKSLAASVTNRRNCAQLALSVLRSPATYSASRITALLALRRCMHAWASGGVPVYSRRLYTAFAHVVLIRVF